MTNEILSTLSTYQRAFVEHEGKKIFVAAAPGSGKTYVTSVKLVDQYDRWQDSASGIATLSFTNIAEKEITKKVASLTDGKIDAHQHPHFVGTLDAFINRYIFFPYGHLILGCKQKPRLVGGPHGSFFKDDYIKHFFETTGFDIDDPNKLIALNKFPLVPWRNAGTMSAIIKSKKNFLKAGFANQYDANNVALQVLTKYPVVARILAARFPFIIIDEVQDTSELHLRILKKIFDAGVENIALIGDLDQAIFEWNRADINKLRTLIEPYDVINLPENRRSSQQICNFVLPLSSHTEMISMNDELKDFPFEPVVIGYDAIGEAVDQFRTILGLEGVTEDPHSSAILCRSAKIYEQAVQHILGVDDSVVEVIEDSEKFWSEDKIYNDLLIRGIAEVRNVRSKVGYDMMTRAVIQKILKKDIRPSEFADIKSDYDLFEIRCELHLAIEQAKEHEVHSVQEWCEVLNSFFANSQYLSEVKFLCEQDVQGSIGDILKFASAATADLPVRVGTIHTAKGETIENVMVCIDKRFGNNKAYKTMIANTEKGIEACTEEEMRVVYVALTRASKRLVFAVPNQDLSLWKSFLSRR